MYKKYQMLLERDGVTSYQVAKETGITQQILSNWKNRQEWYDRHAGGKMAGLSVANLKKLADYFGVSLDYFMED